MMKIRTLALFCMSLAALSLLLALLLSADYWLAGACVLSFSGWGYAFWRRLTWAAPLGLGLVGFFAILGVLLEQQDALAGLNFYLLLLSVLLALAGYDLSDLDLRWRIAGLAESAQGERLRHHGIRLGLVLLAGFGLALLAYSWDISLQFGWLTILALLGVFGLGFMIYTLLNNQSE
jgi:hypothetical protein